MDTELLSLKWNNHKNSFIDIIKVLRNKASYTDATLACEGKFYQVHKVVLSVCSNYFEEIFEITTCKNPVIVLKDVSSSCLEFLLDYMYLGEVNVKQTELSMLIKAAECLQIKGLAVPDDEPINTRESKKNKLSSDDVPNKRRKKKNNINSTHDEQNSKSTFINIAEDPVIEEIKREPIDLDVTQETNKLPQKVDELISIEKEEFDYGSFQNDPSSSGVENDPEETWKDYTFDEDNTTTEDMDKNPDDPNMLLLPANSSEKSRNYHSSWNRPEVHTFSFPWICKICHKTVSSKRNLRVHIRTHSGEKPFMCKLCKLVCSDKSNMTRHIRLLHKFRPGHNIKDFITIKCLKSEIKGFY